MREILFRGKHICGNGDWIYGYYFQKPDPCTKDGKPIAHCISDLPPFGSEIVISTLGQFTGLTDKHGTKIFEGDIVRLDIAGIIFNAVCKFHSGSFGLVWHYMGADRWQSFTGMCHVEYEVIGNIHDNPELMEGD